MTLKTGLLFCQVRKLSCTALILPRFSRLFQNFNFTFFPLFRYGRWASFPLRRPRDDEVSQTELPWIVLVMLQESACTRTSLRLCVQSCIATVSWGWGTPQVIHHSFLMIAPGHSTLEISDSSLAGQTLTWGENLTRLSPHVRVWPARLQWLPYLRAQ